jgi:hypothetical protein
MIPYQLLSKAEKVVYQSLAPFFGVLIWMRSLILALAFRLLHVRGGILGPVQMILRQMKHPFLVKMIQVVILISLSGQRFVYFAFLEVSYVVYAAPNALT